MNNWFTVEKIDSETFALSEYEHWEETHSYLVCGRERAVLIDAGLGVSDISAVVGKLTALPVTAVLTHAHWDHIGGLCHFSRIAVHEAEKDWLNGHFPLPLSAIRENLTYVPCRFPVGFDPEAYQIFQGEPQMILHDGDQLDLGGRILQVIHTPGHSPGHCCFYDPDRQYLFSGDLICAGRLDAFYPTTDPLLFHESIRKVCTYPITRILPGHHQLDIHASMADDIAAAFDSLQQEGKLYQGSGTFDFGAFRIRI